MPQKRLRQYILYNLGIWFATALAATLLIVAVRQYGTQVTAHREAENLLVEAKALLQGNAAFECQRAVEEAVRVYPPIAGQVVEAFGDQLLGLPVIHARLRATRQTAAAVFSPRGQALLDVLNYPPAKAIARVAEISGQAADPAPQLWYARLALDQGDIPGAAQAFTRYWESQPDRRQAVRRELTSGKPADAIANGAVARRLFHAGLWTETFFAVEQARKQGFERPSFGYYDGVKLEVQQKPDEAAAAYANVLATTPDYRPAQLALARLKGGG
ncbi:MAG: hypothetical protein IT368_02745 [Candidatus Hydrogenedentes bacterium]|nr:hypothetical protein [Candidatus Hydrogenedentota bacterium]